jgi:CubicO group peptidase (beta-lactamase class C family)
VTAPEVAVHGTVEPGFEGVLAAFEENFATHGDVGASVAVTIGGRMVVDLWGGTASFDGPDDDDAGVPGVEGDWHEDTIINVWSTTKTMAALVCLMLADRGQLDLYEPIATYWPEFAANGKDQIATATSCRTRRSRRTGTSRSTRRPPSITSSALLAAQAPWWEPGTQSGTTPTPRVPARRDRQSVDGRTLGTFFAEEVAGPLDADFHIGTPAECDPRIARLIGSGPIDAGDDPTSIPYRTFNNPPYLPELSWLKDWRRAEIPGGGGHGNARSVALCHAPTACGGTANGVTLLSEDGVARIFDAQYEGPDLNLLVPLTFGMGFALYPGSGPYTRECGWGGWGGSLAIVNVDAQMSFAYVMNRMMTSDSDMRRRHLLSAAYEALMA